MSGDLNREAANVAGLAIATSAMKDPTATMAVVVAASLISATIAIRADDPRAALERVIAEFARNTRRHVEGSAPVGFGKPMGGIQ